MYPLTLDLVDFLVSDHAQRGFESFTDDDLAPDRALSVISRLRKSFTPEQAAVLLDQVRLRHRARTKFHQASRMLFTDEALQQSSGPEVAEYHAVQ